MKYYLLLLSLACLSISSCTLEKQIYSRGYHIEWRHSSHQPEKSEPVEEKQNNITIQANSNSDEIFLTDERSYIPGATIGNSTDTIIPDNPAKTDEEYVSPEILTPKKSEQTNLAQPTLSDENKAQLEQLTNYLIISAALTIFPFSIFYLPVLIINLSIVNKIKKLAKLSPDEGKYLEKIKIYRRIMLWPVYFLAAALIIILFVAGLSFLFWNI